MFQNCGTVTKKCNINNKHTYRREIRICVFNNKFVDRRNSSLFTSSRTKQPLLHIVQLQRQHIQCGGRSCHLAIFRATKTKPHLTYSNRYAICMRAHNNKKSPFDLLLHIFREVWFDSEKQNSKFRHSRHRFDLDWCCDYVCELYLG